MKTNTVIQGFIGAGKSRSLLTLLPEWADEVGEVHRGAGLTTLVLSLEPGFVHTSCGNGCDQGLHTHYHYPADVDWDTIGSYVKLLNSLSLKDVVEMSDPKKRNYTGFAELFNVCKDFTCDTCGRSFGPINSLDDTYAVALDSLSPLSVLI